MIKSETKYLTQEKPMAFDKKSGNNILKFLTVLLAMVAAILLIFMIAKSCQNGSAESPSETTPGATDSSGNTPEGAGSPTPQGTGDLNPTPDNPTPDNPTPTNGPTEVPTNVPGLTETDYLSMPLKAPAKEGGTLVISEVMSSNTKYLAVGGEYHDWVEIANISSSPVNLSGYTLSDRKSKPDKYKLPNKTLQPGEYVIIYCSGLTSEYHAPFKISASGEALYIFKDGSVVDFVAVPGDIGSDNTYARYGSEWIYSVKPTPGGANAAGRYRRLAAPTANIASGCYTDTIKVTLAGEGKIYYTTDGFAPSSKSKAYTGPIEITKPTSLRVVSVRDGETSAESDFTYVVDKTASKLPVLNIAVDMNLLTGENGVFADISEPFIGTEAPILATLIEDGEEKFSVPCGFKLNGNDSRKGEKKSFRLRFKSTYGPSKLNYKVFDNLDIDSFESLILRGGSEDFKRSMIRDELCADAFDGLTALNVQASKAVVLYIGGEYWGVYFIRERINEDYVEEHYGADADKVELVESNLFVTAGESKDFNSLMSYCKNHDLNVEEYFNYVKERVDLNGLIDWFICRSYVGDHDIGNARMFKAADYDNVWHYICFDLDWSFLVDRVNEDTFKWYVNNTNDEIFKALFKTSRFKKMIFDRFEELKKGALSDANILAMIDKYEAIIESDIERDRIRWGTSYTSWKSQVNDLRKFITSGRLAAYEKNLKAYLGG